MAYGCYMAVHCRSSSVTMVDARVVVVEVDEVMASVVVVVVVVVVALAIVVAWVSVVSMVSRKIVSSDVEVVVVEVVIEAVLELRLTSEFLRSPVVLDSKSISVGHVEVRVVLLVVR